MTTIVARSPFVSSELARMSGGADVAVYRPPAESASETDARSAEDACEWLTRTLERNRVSVVFFDTSFFVDSSRFRAVSPTTRFVAIAGDGDEDAAEEALVNGACAVVGKPMHERDVSGVMSLVSD